MSLSSLRRLAPGLCDIESDQSAATIINIDTSDVDDSGMPLDTSVVPEADMEEANSDVAIAVESADTAEDLGEAIEGTEVAVEALEAIARERRGMTRIEKKLINGLIASSAGKLYSSANSRMLSQGVLSPGIESAAGDNGYTYVLACIEEGKLSIMEWIKKQIAMIVNFVKGIFKSVGTFISGSKKVKTRLEGYAKKATEDAATFKEGAIDGKVALSKRLLSGSATPTVKVITDNIGKLAKTADDFLVKDAGIKVINTAFNAIGDFAPESKPDENAVVAKFRAQAKDLDSIFGSGQTGGMSLIGGLQVIQISNPDEFSVGITTKVNDLAGVAEIAALSVAEVTAGITASLALLAPVEAYQSGWAKREATRKEMEKALGEFGKQAGKGYSEANGKAGDDKDGMIKAYQTKKKISGAVSSSMVSVIKAETAILSHSISVASAFANLAGASLQARAKAKSGEKPAPAEGGDKAEA